MPSCSQILTFHAETWAYLHKLMVLPFIDFLEGVLTEEYPVIPVDEGYHSLATVLWNWKQVLQDVAGLENHKRWCQRLNNFYAVTIP